MTNSFIAAESNKPHLTAAACNVGKLSEEQDLRIPEPLRGAFTIEALRELKATDLARELRFKTQVAEEMQNGQRYVALKDFRCVQFSDELSGQMIVIERYRILPESAPNSSR